MPEIFPRAYQDASKLASLETGLDKDIFPFTCEWTLQQVLNEDWLPE